MAVPVTSPRRRCIAAAASGASDSAARRQREQDEGGEAAVRRMHANLPADLESLADHVREVVEDLGQIAAGIPLNQHGGDEEPDVEDRDALGHLVERVAERKAEVLLVEGLLELGPDRRLH